MRIHYSIATGWLVLLLCTAFVLDSGSTRTRAASGETELQSVLTVANAAIGQPANSASSQPSSNALVQNMLNGASPSTAAATPAGIQSARTNVDRYIDVATAIDPELGEILAKICSEQGQDPVELERMIRRYGRGLVALANLKESDPGFYRQKIMELNLDAEIGKQARRMRDLKAEYGDEAIIDAEMIQLEASVRARLKLSIQNRERSIQRLHNHIEKLQGRVTHDTENFDVEIDRQLDQLMGELDAVQAALGR
ncbi:MAG: hypothetical protein MK116_02565 [Phycisphaerales bacterium]|nr:hypothetical protein [Phycisphaerales bacterium]